MARVNYWAILEELAEVLRAGIPRATVLVEEEVVASSEMSPVIGVYLEERTAAAQQSIAAGMRMDYELTLSVWCFLFGLDMQAAMKERDALIGEVEVLLMANRSLNGLVDTSWQVGGELPSARLPDNLGFVAGGEVRLVASVTATT